MRRNRHRDPVTPHLFAFIVARQGGVCIAVILGEPASDCWGRLTGEHVKEALRSSRRAQSDPAHFVAACEGHTEAGARAGRQWNTAKENRARVRDWLVSHPGSDYVPELRRGARED